MRLYHIAVLAGATAIVVAGCDPLGSGNPTSAGQDSAGGTKVSASVPDFDFVGIQTAGPLGWVGDGSKVLMAGVTTAVSGGGVVVLSPLTFISPSGTSPTISRTLSGPILSVVCDQGTNCYADLVDGRILRFGVAGVAGDTSTIAPQGNPRFLASDNARFIARPRVDSSGIELIDVITKARLTFPGSSLTPLLGISPDGTTAVEAAGTGIAKVDVQTGTSTSTSLPQHAGWVLNSIVAAHWSGTTPHLYVLTRWDSLTRSRFYESDVDANTELMLGETNGTRVTVIGATWRPAVHRAVASVQTQCLQAQLGNCNWWQFDLLLFDNGTATRIARTTGETMYIVTLSPDGKTAGYLSRELSGTFLYLKALP